MANFNKKKILIKCKSVTSLVIRNTIQWTPIVFIVKKGVTATRRICTPFYSLFRFKCKEETCGKVCIKEELGDENSKLGGILTIIKEKPGVKYLLEPL